MEATNDPGAGRFLEAESLPSPGDAPVGFDPGARALSPDIRPPRAAWSGTHDGTFFPSRQLPGGERSGTDFAVFFVRVVLPAQFLQERVSGGQGRDLLGRKKRGQTFLPKIVEPFDFALAWGVGAKRRETS